MVLELAWNHLYLKYIKIKIIISEFIYTFLILLLKCNLSKPIGVTFARGGDFKLYINSVSAGVGAIDPRMKVLF